MADDTYDVFVSYSRADGRHAAEIDSVLRDKGLMPLMPVKLADRRSRSVAGFRHETLAAIVPLHLLLYLVAAYNPLWWKPCRDCSSVIPAETMTGRWHYRLG